MNQIAMCFFFGWLQSTEASGTSSPDRSSSHFFCRLQTAEAWVQAQAASTDLPRLFLFFVVVFGRLQTAEAWEQAQAASADLHNSATLLIRDLNVAYTMVPVQEARIPWIRVSLAEVYITYLTTKSSGDLFTVWSPAALPVTVHTVATPSLVCLLVFDRHHPLKAMAKRVMWWGCPLILPLPV